MLPLALLPYVILTLLTGKSVPPGVQESLPQSHRGSEEFELDVTSWADVHLPEGEHLTSVLTAVFW